MRGALLRWRIRRHKRLHGAMSSSIEGNVITASSIRSNEIRRYEVKL